MKIYLIQMCSSYRIIIGPINATQIKAEDREAGDQNILELSKSANLDQVISSLLGPGNWLRRMVLPNNNKKHIAPKD